MMTDNIVRVIAERTAEVFRHHLDDAVLKRQQVEIAVQRLQQWLDALPAGYGRPNGADPGPAAPNDTPDLVDPDAVISGYRCALCGDPETTARPITTWSFSLPDGHWHMLACPACAFNRIGAHIRDGLSLPAAGYDAWKINFYKFIRENGQKVRKA